MFMSEKYCKGNHCGECCGGVCFESDGSISLSDGELEILMEFAQFEYALILSGLQKKGMIR